MIRSAVIVIVTFMSKFEKESSKVRSGFMKSFSTRVMSALQGGSCGSPSRGRCVHAHVCLAPGPHGAHQTQCQSLQVCPDQLFSVQDMLVLCHDYF